MPRITINGQSVTAPMGSCLSNWLHQSGVSFPCGGHGICGKCRVWVEGEVSPVSAAELRLLSTVELQQGIRVACLTYVAGDCTVWTESPKEPVVCIAGDKEIATVVPHFTHYGVAVDIGTTTLAARLYDCNGVCLSQVGAINPQTAFGADVLTRAMIAAERGQELAEAVRGGIRALIRQLAEQASLKMEQIDGLLITGNTIMLCLLTETSVDSCIRAPFQSHRLFGEYLSVDNCGLRGACGAERVFLPRCLDTFLGADLMCAMQAVELCSKARTALLVDVGTNGEMALWHQGRLFVCSTAAGPAFEGVGISCGMTATDGAIDRVQIVNGRLHTHSIGKGAVIGICGSGMVDALACLLDLGELETDGTMCADSLSVDGVLLTQEDVRNLQVAKSAVCSGIESLLNMADITAEQVEDFYIAGGFGSALNPAQAGRIGLFPASLVRCAHIVNNAALDGACMQLLNTADDSLLMSVNGMYKLDLATDPYFADAFVRNMNF